MTDESRAQELFDAVRDSLQRQADAQRQMQERSGPIYDLVKKKSPAMHAAWVAAGSPPEVMGLLGIGNTPMLAAPWKRERRIVPATPEQAAAWSRWLWIRTALRAELDTAAEPSTATH